MPSLQYLSGLFHSYFVKLYWMLFILTLGIIVGAVTIGKAKAGGGYEEVIVAEFEILKPDRTQVNITLVPLENKKFSILSNECKKAVINIHYAPLYSYIFLPDFVTFAENDRAVGAFKEAMIKGEKINLGIIGGGLMQDRKNKCQYYSKSMWIDNSAANERHIISFFN